MDLIRNLPATASDEDFVRAEKEMRAELAEKSGAEPAAGAVTIFGVGVYEPGNHYVVRAVIPES